MSENQDCVTAAEAPNKALLFEMDDLFNHTYQQGLKQSETPNAKRRPERFYNTVQFFLQTLDLSGSIAECGCWKGLSSYIFCSYIKAINDGFRGENYHIFDSFQGLNHPTTSDTLPQATAESLQSKFGTVKGAFQADLSHVKNTLKDFPHVTYHKGWIPDTFRRIPDRDYRFIHVDVDLYEPTFRAVEYFYPRLVTGGIMVCDDYGSLAWPGAKRAIDEFCQKQGIKPLTLSTGQAVLFKQAVPGSLENKTTSKAPPPKKSFGSLPGQLLRWFH